MFFKIQSTPKKSIQGRRLSAIGPPGGIDAGGIDMGAFLDEMKGVKLKKVSDAVKKERELSFKSKGKNEDEITAVLRESHSSSILSLVLTLISILQNELFKRNSQQLVDRLPLLL